MDLDDAIDQRAEFRSRASEEYWRTFGAMRSNLPEAWHSTTWIGDRAVRQLEAWHSATGNVLYASFIKPHHPFDPPAPWDTMYDPASLTIPPGWTEALPAEDDTGRAYFPNEKLDETTLRRVMAHYYGSISHIDQQVGRMVEALKRRGLYDRTLIVFTADHGEYLGFHHMLLKGGRMYEPLTRVPLLIKYPEHGRPSVHGGEVRQTLVSNVDVAPTIVHACGLVPHPQMRGLDLSNPASDRDAVFVEGGRGGRYMVRTRQHKLLLAPEPAQTGFYDLEADPLELDNRFQDPACQDTIRDLRDRLAQWMLFDSPTPSYVDDQAPVIDAPNVPADLRPSGDRAARDARRRQVLDFYEQQLQEHARK
jgi:arylsulfatase A-like enzyme